MLFGAGQVKQASQRYQDAADLQVDERSSNKHIHEGRALRGAEKIFEWWFPNVSLRCDSSQLGQVIASPVQCRSLQL